jgi:hypothetical protein
MHSKSVLIILLLLFVFSTINSQFEPEVIIPDTLNHPDTSLQGIPLTICGLFSKPVNGKVISSFGKRGRRYHTGTDIKLSKGDTVYAALGGKVIKATRFYGYGKMIVIEHDSDYQTYYAHLSGYNVNVGDRVAKGQAIGFGGRTGRATTCHLHFEIRYKGKAYNAEAFINKMNNNNLKPETDNAALACKNQNSLPDNSIPSKKIIHYIKKKDTLYSLSKKYGTTVEKVCATNNILPQSKLKIGDKLIIETLEN